MKDPGQFDPVAYQEENRRRFDQLQKLVEAGDKVAQANARSIRHQLKLTEEQSEAVRKNLSVSRVSRWWSFLALLSSGATLALVVYLLFFNQGNHSLAALSRGLEQSQADYRALQAKYAKIKAILEESKPGSAALAEIEAGSTDDAPPVPRTQLRTAEDPGAGASPSTRTHAENTGGGGLSAQGRQLLRTVAPKLAVQEHIALVDDYTVAVTYTVTNRGKYRVYFPEQREGEPRYFLSDRFIVDDKPQTTVTDTEILGSYPNYVDPGRSGTFNFEIQSRQRLFAPASRDKRYHFLFYAPVESSPRAVSAAVKALPAAERDVVVGASRDAGHAFSGSFTVTAR